MTRVVCLISTFLVLLCSGQLWAYAPMTASSYSYDSVEYFVLDRNTDSESENQQYDGLPNLHNYHSESLSNEFQEKAYAGSFLVLLNDFIVTKGTSPQKLFHFTQSSNADAIAKGGLRPGSSGKVFTTPQGNLSPLQAQIDLALPPNRGLPDALFEIDAGKLKQLGVNVPAPSQVGRSFNLPGGGLEVPIGSRIPPEALRRIR